MGIINFFSSLWCLAVHDFIMGKHKMIKAYGYYVCQICKRQ